MNELERLLLLTEFDGNARQGFIALHRFFNAVLPDLATVVLQNETSTPNQYKIAGHLSASGHEWVAGNIQTRSSQKSLLHFDQLLEQCSVCQTPVHLILTEQDNATPFSRALHHPSSLIVFPAITVDQSQFQILLANARKGWIPDIDLHVLWQESQLAFSLLRGGLMRNIAARQLRHISGLADIQRLLQPQETRIRGLHYAVHWQPADTAAGDYYDLMPLTHIFNDFIDTGSDAWGMMIADVSGHGAAAAMEAVQFDAILRTYRGDEEPLGPAGAATYANRYFFSRRQRSHFLTAFGVSVRPDQKTMQWLCAGHPPAIRRRDNELTWLGRGNQAEIPLGVLRDHRWRNIDLDWRPGDLLLVYTDGVIEARDAQGQMFGNERLATAFGEAPNDAHAALHVIREALFEHQGRSIGTDDQTLIVIQQAI
jgi:sigma-B regulation protein RsbU (phosphoserine phosphatase)